MTKVKLKGINKVKVKGRYYYYLGRGRGAVRLEGLPGSPEFLESYQAGRTPAQALDKRRLKAWVILYRTERFPDLKLSTQRVWRPWLDEIQEYFGELSVRLFDRPQIRRDIRIWRDKWKATPRTADLGKQVLSRLLSFVIEEGELAHNPCEHINNLYSNCRAERIWTDDDLSALLNVAIPEVAWVVRLALLTGMRQGDLLRLSWTNISDTCVEIRTGKSNQRRIATIPLYQPVRELLSEIPKRATTVLTNSRGMPWRAFGTSWNKTLKNAGLEARGLHFHDLRGTAATRFYKAGTSTRVIAEMMGWSPDKVERMIDRYVKRDEIMLDEIRRLNQIEGGTKMQN